MVEVLVSKVKGESELWLGTFGQGGKLERKWDLFEVLFGGSNACWLNDMFSKFGGTLLAGGIGEVSVEVVCFA